MTDHTVVLSPREALIADISTPPEEQHFDAEPAIESSNVEVRIGGSPLLVDLTERSRATKEPLAPELSYLNSRFRVMLLRTAASVLKSPGWGRVSALQYTLDFDERTEIAIIDMLPKPEIVKSAQVQLGTDSNVKAEVQANGEFGLQLPIGGSASASASIGTQNRVGILANFEYTIYAVRTQAIGQYGKTAIWNLVSDGSPLVGDFIFATTLLIDQLAESLKFKVRIAATISRAGLFPEKRISDWIPYKLSVEGTSQDKQIA
jgi:hypothetical protein